MAELLTVIKLDRGPRAYASWGNWGKRTRAQMIAEFRQNAVEDLAKAQAILDADDSEFEVAEYRGQKKIRDVL